MRPRRRRRRISPPSCAWSRASACSTSAAAGAASRSISPGRRMSRCSESPCPRRNCATPAPARRRKGSPAGCGSSWLDWREVEGRFDRIVSVGMFEHVGPPHYRRFLARCRELLATDGADAPPHDRPRRRAGRDRPLDRQIYLPRRLRPRAQPDRAGDRAIVAVADRPRGAPRLHYARTLDTWYERVQAAQGEIVALYDERFFRMWQFYLAGGIAAFRHDGHLVFQLQLARRRDGAAADPRLYGRGEALVRPVITVISGDLRYFPAHESDFRRLADLSDFSANVGSSERLPAGELGSGSLVSLG